MTYGRVLLAACVAVAGCGGPDASPREQDAVRELVPGAEQIGCERVDASLRRCHAVSGNALAGAVWTCEFKTDRDPGGAAYSGSRSCWTGRD